MDAAGVDRVVIVPPSWEGERNDLALADWVWAEAEQQGIALMILVPQNMVAAIDNVAARYPNLKIVMDHMALTSGKPFDEAFKDFDKLLLIAKRPNVAVKASALPCYSDEPYPFTRVQAYARKAYEAFGGKRTFWGSDLSRSPVPYRSQIDMWLNDAPWLMAEDKEWVMGRGICEWLGWKLP